MIGLDGYEPSIGDRMMAEGRMPHLRALRDRSARWRLEHGLHRNTGLAFEQLACGLAPDISQRWSAVELDTRTYTVWQSGAVHPPFPAHLDVKTVVFDAPYYDLSKDGGSFGIVNWGAHDPGVKKQSRPASLADEIESRVGPYKATDYIYGFLWPDEAKTREAGRLLVEALDQRTDVMRWLISERFDDWDLAISVVSELHSAIEPMWHGMDEGHALHNIPSAKPAREGLEAVYQALDRHIGTLQESAPDATVVCFAMHGMGHNDADLPGMLLLPEMIYRYETGKEFFSEPEEWRQTSDGVPVLPANTPWDRPILKAMRGGEFMRVKDKIERTVGKFAAAGKTEVGPERQNSFPLKMPAARYAGKWPQMRAFGFPAFYDARVRFNLVGREAQGLVPLSSYDDIIGEYSQWLREIVDPRTGTPAVKDILLPVADDPLAAHPTQADIIVTFNGAPQALEHPNTGTVGPVPYRRTGGHTGPFGVLYVSGEGIAAGQFGTRSSFDVVPTVADLLGRKPAVRLSGEAIAMPVLAS
ncbi:alkaline phosphatase family protein [Novosphingobium malaysiense]|uniref:alkaline phosphatase family protein n=1 Tax=Novosphingobium malaysiense TaxID=1348853 RepID=UPI00068C5823|nr:alkaline phosphatase family protein [Novosphingobium malaysiense]